MNIHYEAVLSIRECIFFLNARSAQKTSVFLVLKAPREVRKQKKYSSS